MNRRSAVVGLALAATASTAASPATETKPTAKHRILNRQAGSSYCQAHEVSDMKRWVFISGQIPVGKDQKVPADFKSQARLVWANIIEQLQAASMTLDDLVKITVFLSDRRYRKDNYEVRHEVLGERAPALTIIIAGIYDEAWLLEIEAVAAA
jgi:2-iminobutanoate/2-iminopropanoate deaminase